MALTAPIFVRYQALDRGPRIERGVLYYFSFQSIEAHQRPIVIDLLQQNFIDSTRWSLALELSDQFSKDLMARIHVTPKNGETHLNSVTTALCRSWVEEKILSTLLQARCIDVSTHGQFQNQLANRHATTLHALMRSWIRTPDAPSSTSEPSADQLVSQSLGAFFEQTPHLLSKEAKPIGIDNLVPSLQLFLQQLPKLSPEYRQLVITGLAALLKIPNWRRLLANHMAKQNNLTVVQDEFSHWYYPVFLALFHPLIIAKTPDIDKYAAELNAIHLLTLSTKDPETLSLIKENLLLPLFEILIQLVRRLPVPEPSKQIQGDLLRTLMLTHHFLRNDPSYFTRSPAALVGVFTASHQHTEGSFRSFSVSAFPPSGMVLRSPTGWEANPTHYTLDDSGGAAIFQAFSWHRMKQYLDCSLSHLPPMDRARASLTFLDHLREQLSTVVRSAPNFPLPRPINELLSTSQDLSFYLKAIKDKPHFFLISPASLQSSPAKHLLISYVASRVYNAKPCPRALPAGVSLPSQLYPLHRTLEEHLKNDGTALPAMELEIVLQLNLLYQLGYAYPECIEQPWFNTHSDKLLKKLNHRSPPPSTTLAGMGLHDLQAPSVSQPEQPGSSASSQAVPIMSTIENAKLLKRRRERDATRAGKARIAQKPPMPESLTVMPSFPTEIFQDDDEAGPSEPCQPALRSESSLQELRALSNAMERPMELNTNRVPSSLTLPSLSLSRTGNEPAATWDNFLSGAWTNTYDVAQQGGVHFSYRDNGNASRQEAPGEAGLSEDPTSLRDSEGQSWEKRRRR